MKVLKSAHDASVNYVQEALTGFIESRYVRKCPEYFICYLSSQTACNRGCKFCWLTASRQTRNVQNVTWDGYMDQVWEVLHGHYEHSTDEEKATTKYCHLNWMARGEPLCNELLLTAADELLMALGRRVNSFGPHLGIRHNISTIMPQSFAEYELQDVFKTVHPTIYYSMYSTNEEFRRKWLPGAMPVRQALEKLARWQKFSKKLIKIHYCLIAGENDSMYDARDIVDLISEYSLRVEFNLVRYNPHSQEQGAESSDEQIAHYMRYMNDSLSGVCKVIPRVGVDCAASCGMFVNKKGNV